MIEGSVKVLITTTRMARLLATSALFLICLSCGQNYRPVATPQSPNPPNPNFSHIALVVSSNGADNPGAATTIDVSGDSAVSQTATGLTPAYAVLADSGTRAYVANRGEDTVSSFSPNSPGSPTVTTLPPGSAPVFVLNTQNVQVYVANSGNNTVSLISGITNLVTNTVAVGVNPVAMAALPNGSRVYVANAGNGATAGSLSSINTLDFSVNPPLSGVSWVSPAWVAARSDNQRVFVLDKSAGTVTEIDTAGTVDAVMGNVAVGAGADFLLYDSKLSRLYVTNPLNGTVYVLDAADSLSGGKISTIATILIPGAVSVAALPDSSRFYVASELVSGAKVTSSVTVVDAASFGVEKTIALATVPQACALFVNSPFALSIVASADSSRVYAGNCDAGSTAIIATVANNSPGSEAPEDTLVKNLPAPLSAQPPVNGAPPPQSPVFVLAGP